MRRLGRGVGGGGWEELVGKSRSKERGFILLLSCSVWYGLDVRSVSSEIIISQRDLSGAFAFMFATFGSFECGLPRWDPPVTWQEQSAMDTEEWKSEGETREFLGLLAPELRPGERARVGWMRKPGSAWEELGGPRISYSPG